MKMSTSSSPRLGSSADVHLLQVHVVQVLLVDVRREHVAVGVAVRVFLFPEVSSRVYHFAGGGLAKPSWMSRSSHLICTCPMS